MQLTFGNMTLELNIFHLSKKYMPLVEEDQEQVCQIDAMLPSLLNSRIPCSASVVLGTHILSP